MYNKDDWKELEQWNAQREEEQKRKLGEYPEGLQRN